MMKSRPMLENEIYLIIRNKDITEFFAIIRREFPKSYGSMSRLNLIELQALIPMLKKAYDS